MILNVTVQISVIFALKLFIREYKSRKLCSYHLSTPLFLYVCEHLTSTLFNISEYLIMKNKWQIIQTDKAISAGTAIQNVTIKYLFCKSVIWHLCKCILKVLCFEVCTQYRPPLARTEDNLWTPQKEIEKLCAKYTCQNSISHKHVEWLKPINKLN